MEALKYLALFLVFCLIVCASALCYALWRAKRWAAQVKNHDILGNFSFVLPMDRASACRLLLRFGVDDTEKFYFDDTHCIITFYQRRDFPYQLIFLEFEGKTYLYAENQTPLRGPRYVGSVNRFFVQKLSATPFDFDTFQRIRLYSAQQKETL